MKKLLFSAVTMLFVATLVLPGLAHADGMVISPPDYYIWENSQEAVIFYEDNLETLAISIQFHGDAANFGWVVPTPTQPEVKKASKKLFVNIDQLTYPQYEYDYDWGFRSSAPAAEKAGSAVEVVEQTKVDYYDITVLKSSEANALSDWFNENGYQFPEKYNYLLNDYINNGWYFTAIKIDPSSDTDKITEELYAGSATPLLMKFETKNIVFPMRLSQVSLPDETYWEGNEDYYGYLDYYSESIYVTLYVIAANKKTATNFYTDYANWHTKTEIKSLATDEVGNPWVEPKQDDYFITRMYGYFYQDNMDEDVFIIDAVDNAKVNTGSDNWYDLVLVVIKYVAIGLLVFVLTLIFLVLSPFILMFIIPAIIIFKIKSHGGRTACLILEILSVFFAVVIVLLGVFFLVWTLAEFTLEEFPFWMAVAGLVAACLILIMQIIVLIKQRRHWKKKQSLK